ncbi:exocyst complex component EXO70A1-like protein [Tanacetum coccineum]
MAIRMAIIATVDQEEFEAKEMKMIRTHAMRRSHENIDKTLKAANVVLHKFDLSREAEAKILKGPHEDLEGYLEAIEQLRGNIRFFTNHKRFKSSDGVLSHSNSLLSKAISKFEHEFIQLLSSYSKPVEPDRLYECLPNSLRPSSGSPDASGKNASNSHTDHINAENAVFKPPVLIPPRVLPLLQDLAQHMVQAGHTQQCLIVYRDTRSQVLQESLLKMMSKRYNVRSWNSKLELGIILCELQKKGVDLRFESDSHINPYTMIVKLLFAAERKVCDQMFEGRESLKDQCFADVTKGSVATLLSFGDAVAKSKRSPEKLFVLLDMYEIMSELHSEIEALFSGKACKEIREGALGLTKRLAQTAKETFRDFEEAVEKDATRMAVADGTVHSLTSYVINYVKFLFDYQSTLKQLFQEFEKGEDSNAELAYILQCLTIQGLNSSGGDGPNSSGASRALVKDRSSIFNLQFEELHQRQSQWTVPDSELQESLRLAVAEVLLPAYRSFIKRFGALVESGKNPHKYIRYTAEDLDRMLGEFFEGKT